tara:strand:- start:488 stop:784 length:297 start_codon:yes stop_codon:yes gene_type:complete
MEYGLHNIINTAIATLIPIYGSGGAIKSISIANQHDTVASHIDLYLDDGTNISYMVKSAVIPPGTALVLDHNISFDNSVLGLKLVAVGTGLPISVIIK